MRIEVFDVYAGLLKEKSGLVIAPEKSSLLQSRLGPVAKKWGYVSFDHLTRALSVELDEDLVSDIIDAMAASDTSFFRDLVPFDVFADAILPYLFKNRAAKSLRLWSAACAAGQEPYSACIILKEKAPPGWKIDFLATDISNEILERAMEASYSLFEAQRGLSIEHMLNHFTQVGGEKWKLRESIRGMVRYSRFNLMDDMAPLGKFDVIFCRNVLTHFDDKTKKSVLERLAARLEKDGFLFLGIDEEPGGLTDLFSPAPGGAGIYVLKNGPLASGRLWA